MKQNKFILKVISSILLSSIFVCCTGNSGDVSQSEENAESLTEESYDNKNDSIESNSGDQNIASNHSKESLDSVNRLRKDFITLSSDVKMQIDSLDKERGNEIYNLNKTVEDQKNSITILNIIGLILVSAFIIIAIVFPKKIISLKDEIANLNDSRNRHREEIDTLKNDSFRTQSTHHVGSGSSQYISYSEYSKILRRLGALEQRAQLTNQTGISQRSEILDKRRDTKKEGYFGSPAEGAEGRGYFKRLLETRDGARFKVEVEGNNAKFTPIVQVGELVSSDAMDLAVAYDGDVDKNDSPSDISIKQPGIAITSGDKWIIQNKAIVVFIK